MRAPLAFLLVTAALSLTACERGTTEGDALEAANEAALQDGGDGQGQADAEAGADAPGVALSAEGIALGNTAIPFGTARATVLAAMEQAGFEAPQTSQNAECGEGPMTFAEYGGLKLNFLDEEMRGWFAQEGSAGVTVDGIRPGIALADLQAERSAAMEDTSTLDGEFSYRAADGSDIGGFVDEKGRITGLFVGNQCFFR
jgi:hypothetical protein